MQENIHNITMEKRQRLTVSACSQVVSFNEEEVVILTNEEKLVIKGVKLKVEEVSKADGEAVITGERIDSLTYFKGSSVKNEGVFRRMFK